MNIIDWAKVSLREGYNTVLRDPLDPRDAVAERIKVPQPRAPEKQLTVAWVIGHTELAPGAVGAGPLAGIHEYHYWDSLRPKIEEFGNKLGHKSLWFYRDVGGIRGAYGRAEDADPDVIIGLHFNAYNGRATGSEGLHYDDQDAVGLKERELVALMSANFSKALRIPDRGPKERKPGQRAHGNVDQVRHIPSIVTEPFFGDNPGDAHNAVKYEERMISAFWTSIEQWREMV